MNTRNCLWLFAAGVLLSSPMAVHGSTIYYPRINQIEIINDDDSATYLRSTVNECKEPLFTNAANRYPWGKSKGETRGVWMLSDSDFKEPILSVVKRLRAWQKSSLKQKLSAPDIGGNEAMRNCIESAQADIDWRTKEASTAQEEMVKCSSQGKSIRATSRGRLCLSDFEFAQLQILEEQKATQEAQRQVDEQYRQAQEQAQEQERRRQAWGNALRNMSETLQQSKPRNCYGSSTGYGNYRTYRTTCY